MFPLQPDRTPKRRRQGKLGDGLELAAPYGRQNVLAPTAEEVITHIGARELNSYKQLPVNLYQINTKFRDESRATETQEPFETASPGHSR